MWKEQCELNLLLYIEYWRGVDGARDQALRWWTTYANRNVANPKLRGTRGVLDAEQVALDGDIVQTAE